MDQMVLGWHCLIDHDIVRNLEDILQVQRSMNLVSGMIKDNDNVTIENMDGVKITSDSLRWAEDLNMPALIPNDGSSKDESALEEAQANEQERLISDFEDVFNPLPAGSALVEPMTVTMKPDFVRPPMMSFRMFAPEVETAIEVEIKSMLEEGFF